MSADIIQFVPRSTAKADRAFWLGPAEAFFDLQIASIAIMGEIVEQALADTAPCEYVAPDKDAPA